MASISQRTNNLTSRSFLYGLGAGLSVYALLAGWAFFSGPASLQAQQERLAAQTVSIDRIQITAPEEAPAPAPAMEEDDLATEVEPVEPTPPALPEMQAAPYPGLYETDAKGDLLPMIRPSDGLTPFHAYRKPFMLQGEQKLIALVIDDYGLSRSHSNNSASALPAEITFLLSPYASDADAMQATARSNGHELWLKLPLENQNFPQDDPGSKAILSRVSLEKNMENLRWALSRSSGYAGVALYNDLTFTKTKSTLNAILKASVDRGLGLFDMNISAPAQISEMASQQNTPYIKNEIFFYDPKWAGDTSAAAEFLETIAESRGHAVGVFKNYPGTIEFIERWAPVLARKGFTLAPLSAIYLSQNPAAPRSMPPVQENANASN